MTIEPPDVPGREQWASDLLDALKSRRVESWFYAGFSLVFSVSVVLTSARDSVVLIGSAFSLASLSFLFARNATLASGDIESLEHLMATSREADKP